MKEPRAPRKRVREFNRFHATMEFDPWKRSFLDRDFIPGHLATNPDLTPQSLTEEEMSLLKDWYNDYYYFEEVGYAILEYRKNNLKPISTPKPELSQLELF